MGKIFVRTEQRKERERERALSSDGGIKKCAGTSELQTVRVTMANI